MNLLLQVMFVGILLGLFRTVIPALSESEFSVPKNSFLFLATFIIAFGIVKGIANYYAGVFADKYNRKTVLLLGWLVAFPVPFIIYFATYLEWMNDTSKSLEKTMTTLDQYLNKASKILNFIIK